MMRMFEDEEDDVGVDEKVKAVLMYPNESD